VVNLVPEEEKQLAFNEMFRLLKPGGRVAIADILTKRELPPELKTNMALYVGCIAGASQVQDYEKYLQEAGFTGKYPKYFLRNGTHPVLQSDLNFPNHK
jgi:ubiquinone/menaquinone biosynthesis C-methylase UbiE